MLNSRKSFITFHPLLSMSTGPIVFLNLTFAHYFTIAFWFITVPVFPLFGLLWNCLQCGNVLSTCHFWLKNLKWLLSACLKSPKPSLTFKAFSSGLRLPLQSFYKYLLVSAEHQSFFFFLTLSIHFLLWAYVFLSHHTLCFSIAATLFWLCPFL